MAVSFYSASPKEKFYFREIALLQPEGGAQKHEFPYFGEKTEKIEFLVNLSTLYLEGKNFSYAKISLPVRYY